MKQKPSSPRVLRTSPGRSMAQALTILTALQMFSEGGVMPQAEATGEPYGISRAVVEGAARAGPSFQTPSPSGRDLDVRPVPALSQVTPTQTPDSAGLMPPGSIGNPAVNEIIGDMDDLPLVPERTACNGGLGEMRYEKLPDVRLAPNSYDSDVIRKKAMPSAVLALCEDRCLKDRTATQQLTRRCGSIDFVPGRRFTSYSDSIEYTETKCFLSQSQVDRNGVADTSKVKYEVANNYAHLREVCFSASPSSSSQESVLRRECPDRLYVLERQINKSFLPKNIIEVGAKNLEACQTMCLYQQSEDPLNATTICRAGTWDDSRNRCYLSSYTRRTHPADYVEHPDMHYFENTCLSAERRCPKNRLFFLRETNAEMGGPFDLVIFVNVTLNQCKETCIESKTIFCRSIEYDKRARVCVLSDEDSVSRREELRVSTSEDNMYFELSCFDGDKVRGEYLFEAETPLTSTNTEPLNARSLRDVRTAFQLYRNRRLELRSGFRNTRRERSLLTLAECLDECLEERSFACRSVLYSERFQLCQLSEYDQYNGELVYDGESNYFENLMGAGHAGTRSSAGSASNTVGFSGVQNALDDRFSSSGGSRFSFSGDGDGSSRTADNGNRGSRPPSSNTQHGLFRPISTEFNTRNQFNSNTGFGSSSRGSSLGGSTNRGFDRFGGSSVGSSRFGSGGSRFNSVRDDRRGSSFNRNRDPFGSGRFSSTSAGGTNVGSDVFGLAGTGAFGFNTGGDNLGSSSDSKFGSGTSGAGGVASTSRLGTMGEVAQTCAEDGSMEFTLRTDEAFRGRIYSYGYYDRCFYVGRGSTVSILKLTAPRGFQDCGTTRLGDTVTNIVVVQFSENVQTMMDKRYNLTCTTIGPSDSVVTSAYIGAGGNGAPTPIEYLEFKSRMEQRVALRVLYNGRPTTTIAVGDPLTFRLEPQAGYNLVSDIFATNVVAKDPYSGRAVQLIDGRGCPVDNYIFPALGRARSGDGLETRFSAFKIPESNYLVFEANVRPCKKACTPAFCRDTHGRGEVESLGRRRRRDLEERLGPLNETTYTNMTTEQRAQLEEEKEASEGGQMEHVHGIYEVYMSRDEIPEVTSSRQVDQVCLSSGSYHGLVVGAVFSGLCLAVLLLLICFLYRRFTSAGVIGVKNARADSSNPHHGGSDRSVLHQEASRGVFPGVRPRTVPQPARYFPSPTPDEVIGGSSPQKFEQPENTQVFLDPSEPIFTDPTLFEKATPSPTSTLSTSASSKSFHM